MQLRQQREAWPGSKIEAGGLMSKGGGSDVRGARV